MKMIKKILLGFLAAIGCLVILCLVSAGIFIFVSKGGIPGKTILEVDLEQNLIEYVPDDPVARLLLADSTTLRDIIDGLEKASEDERIVALVARVGATDMGMAQIQELRGAIMGFRSNGRPAIAYSETFGEFGPGNTAYYLATAFDKIYLQPSGDLGLTGLVAESVFIKGTLEKLGIIPRLSQRHEYKNFMNLFTESKYTEPHREAVQRVVESQFDQIVGAVAEARGLTREEIRALVNSGPFFGQEAMDAKLVDGLAYRDEVYDTVKEKAGRDAEFLHLTEYLDRAGRPHTEGEQIALIFGVGAVQRGKSRYDPTSGGFTMGSDTVSSAFRAAVKDSDVKAILFRVDSPGGSYVASDAIWREMQLAKKAGKPVVVSMGNLAGSGGYFIAMAADRIVAQPGTITGSIGVLGGKFVAAEFMAKLGVSSDEVHTSENATMWTWTHDYTQGQWSRVEDWLDRVYDDFTDKVAQGRGLPEEKVSEVAKGRIWTGEDARTLGLVDELGGLPEAMHLAMEQVGISPEAKVCLKVFPEKKSVLRMILERGPESSEDGGLGLALYWVLGMIQRALIPAHELNLGSHCGALTMSETQPVR